ncbi:Undecaprenyl pyrophosphate synthetase family protein [Forsythia ovata]|uniref:ditrans,polycis-polyprenyl diphosphate synthase [(2E,6E)-farnesyldiphosphate specific] n=1 Tax=Forsythia ovata TaxID=205694 RepID=A0ABD1QLR2_9LAMI
MNITLEVQPSSHALQVFLKEAKKITSNRILDLGDEMQKFYSWMCSSGDLGRCLLWHIIHLIVNIWYLLLRLSNALENCLISSSLLTRYNTLNISKVRYLAIVIDSEEALQIPKVLELVRWLAVIGLKNVCLYDKEGVLKNSKEVIMGRSKSEKMSKETTRIQPLFEHKYMNLEVISFSDGKEAVAKAANFLFEKHYSSANMEKLNLKEADMAAALTSIGCGGTDPDLMLIYGPARCHLGFPAWRMSYTEIVHMGSLKSMNFGSLVKAIHGFTMVHQNYGT